MNACTSLIAILLGWSGYALNLAVYAGACAGLLAMVVLAINALFRRWLSSRQMGLLWGVVLLRLLIPVAPSSTLSLQNLLPSAQTDASQPSDVIRQPAADSGGRPYSQPLSAAPASSDAQALSILEDSPYAIDLSGAIDLFFTMLPMVWLIGGASYLIWTMIVHWRFCRRLKQVTACEDPRQSNLWEACCQQAGVLTRIPIVVFDGVHQPAVLGLFHPRLLLPSDAAELNDQQLRMVMLHELAHVRHWDIAANWVLVLLRAIHWWNPVYWLATARFQTLREQSCDAFAVRRLEGQSTRIYGELLLTLAQRQQSGPAWRVMLPVSILGFFSSFFRKRAVRKRLTALRSAGVTRSRWHTASIAGLIGLVAVCGLTDASTPQIATDRSSDWLPHAGHEWNTWNAVAEIDLGPIVTCNYDIEKVLDRIAAGERTREHVRAEMNELFINLLKRETTRLSASTNQLDGQQNVPSGEQGSLTIDGNMLTVKASANLQAEIVRRLSAWEQSGLGQICIETRFITEERDIASAVGVSWQYLEAFSADRAEDVPLQAKIGMPIVRAKAALDDYLPIAVATLNDRQGLALLQAVQGKRANVLQAPKVTVFNGQQASFVDYSQTPFVVGVQDVSEGVQQPKIVVIDDGIKLALRAIQSSDASKVQLEARVELSRIGEVCTASTLLRGELTTIQVPRVKRCRIDVSSEVQDGQSLLIGCIPTYEQKRFFYVLLTVHNVVTD